MLYKTVFYRNPGILCVIFHTIIQNSSDVKTRMGSILFSFQSGVDLKFSRLFPGKSAYTIVII